MRVQFLTLTLTCKRSKEIIPFSPQVSFFHGQVASGKSTVVRLLDFCMGGDLEKTPALMQEMISAEVTALFGTNEVILRRSLDNTSSVQVSWRDENGSGYAVTAPLKAGENPVWEDSIFNLSDLIFMLLDVEPPKVRRNKRDVSSQFIRLSFRDLLWYCYLPQDEMDSTFFHLEEIIKQGKSQSVLRFVTGYYSEMLNDLEVALQETLEDRLGKINAARQIKEFLTSHELGTVDEVRAEIERTRKDLLTTEEETRRLRDDPAPSEHLTDQLRQELRAISQQVNQQEETISDIDVKISDQESLKAELLSTKFKLARADAATIILTGVAFESCPACGTDVTARDVDKTFCTLCVQRPQPPVENQAQHSEAVANDLMARIEELQDSITRLKSVRSRQERALTQKQLHKSRLDSQLNMELTAYDSAYLSRFREVERRAATYHERLRNLENLLALPEAAESLDASGRALDKEVERLREHIEKERSKLTTADVQVEMLARSFITALLSVAVPGIGQDDQVVIDKKSWKPSILPGGDIQLGYGYNDVGSGGKKTLMKVCFALAMHKVAKQQKLPLPEFLIIDSPMKNVSPEVNEENFHKFYQYLYELLGDELKGTQIIIVDNEYSATVPKEVDIIARRMTPNDPEFPPLISYYRGP